jgi:hypothetical protein
MSDHALPVQGRHGTQHLSSSNLGGQRSCHFNVPVAIGSGGWTYPKPVKMLAVYGLAQPGGPAVAGVLLFNARNLSLDSAYSAFSATAALTDFRRP